MEKEYKFHKKTWELIDSIISYLFREKNMNLAADAVRVRDSLMAQGLELTKLKSGIKTFTVTACHDAIFHKIPCLENDEEYGFFKSDADVRPGHASWIKKEDAERLYQLMRLPTKKCVK